MPILMTSTNKPSGVLFVSPDSNVRQNGPDGEIVGELHYHTNYFDEVDPYLAYLKNHGFECEVLPRELVGAKAIFDLDWVMTPDFEHHIVHDACQVNFKGEILWWVTTTANSILSHRTHSQGVNEKPSTPTIENLREEEKSSSSVTDRVEAKLRNPSPELEARFQEYIKNN